MILNHLSLKFTKGEQNEHRGIHRTKTRRLSYGFSHLHAGSEPLYVLTAVIPMWEDTRELLPNWPQWAILTMGALGLASFVFALAAWKWKKWGVYGIAGAAVVFFVASVIRGGVSIYGALFGLAIAIGILVRLVRPVWQRMR